MNIYGIIPLGGNATRMNHLPKFLLPCKIGVSLLDNTISTFKTNNITQIISGVSKSNYDLLQNNSELTKQIVETKTMAQTVYELIKQINNPMPYKNILIMPDTYFTLTNELQMLNHKLETYSVVAVVWRIKDYQIGKVGQCKIVDDEIVDVVDKNPNCDYPFFWGIMGWNSQCIINPEWETIGELLNYCIKSNIKIGTVVCESNYYDCGTYSEYFTMIKNEFP
jgi:GTP:adenosylcobinamide-phosphate guanylyltransferase